MAFYLFLGFFLIRNWFQSISMNLSENEIKMPENQIEFDGVVQNKYSAGI